MARHNPLQFTEREANAHAGERRIEALSNNPMSYSAAIKRIAKEPEGFLIWDEMTGLHIPATLTDQRIQTINGETDHVVRINKDWDSAAHQGYDGPGWYFWDETQAFCHGPFDNEAAAREGLNEYGRELNGE